MEPIICRNCLRATSSLSVRLVAQRSASRLLHTTASNAAIPLHHPTVPGPPPQAPQASASQPTDRIARKRQQAEAFLSAQKTKVNPSKPTSALKKRFWKDVSVHESDAGLQVHLDTRPVRTANREILTLPLSRRPLATAIALEWDHLTSAQQALKHHLIPLTSLTSRALDISRADASPAGTSNDIRQSIITTCLRYLGTDTLLCWAPEKNLHDPELSSRKPLRQRQREVAEPIIAHLTAHVFPGVEIVPILGEDSIVPIPQPELTRQVIRGWLAGLPAFELAALERCVLATKSLLVAVRVVVEWSSEFAHLREKQQGESDNGNVVVAKEWFGIENAAEAASLEVLHQIEQWGEVEDSHDVEKEDLRRQVGSAIVLVS